MDEQTTLQIEDVVARLQAGGVSVAVQEYPTAPIRESVRGQDVAGS